MKVGAWVLDLRKRRGWSQARLGHEIGSDGACVSRWERDVCNPDLESFRKLCEVFGASADEALGLSGRLALASQQTQGAAQ